MNMRPEPRYGYEGPRPNRVILSAFCRCDYTVDDNLPIILSRPDSNEILPPPIAGVAVLDTLPLELVEQVLLQLDLRTLADFQRVNRRAAELVSSLPSYKAITKHAPNVLRGVLGIDTGRWFTCTTLYSKLCTPWCEQCGNFGGYLYLLTCKRICFSCLYLEPQFLPLPPRDAVQKFGLDKRTVKRLPCMMVIPGTYSPYGLDASRCVLVDRGCALRAGISKHGSSRAMEKFASGIEAEKAADRAIYVASLQQCRRFWRPRSSVGHPLPPSTLPEDPYRFVAIARVPWLNNALQKAEWGFYCGGCGILGHQPFHWKRQFTTASFDEHIRKCAKEAQEIGSDPFWELCTRNHAVVVSRF